MCSDGQYPDFYVEEWRKARKVHKCCACHEGIQPGENYHHIAGKWEGDFETYKHCARCWLIFKAISESAKGESVVLTLDCGTSWEEAFGELPTEIAELAFLSKADAQARSEQKFRRE